MISSHYLALTEACENDRDLARFVRFRLGDVGNARGWPDGHEFEVFVNPSSEDVAELVRRIRYEAKLRRTVFKWSREQAARALEVMGL